MKQAIAEMKSMVKADTAEARQITSRIHAAPRGPEHGPARDKLWNEKRSRRSERRSRLLAYALMRGMPYAVVEAKCAEPASEWHIHQALRKVVADIEMVHYSRERIESWLLGRDARSKAA